MTINRYHVFGLLGKHLNVTVFKKILQSNNNVYNYYLPVSNTQTIQLHPDDNLGVESLRLTKSQLIFR